VIELRHIKSNRLLELDALRGLAALSVVLFHYTTRYQELYGHTLSPSLFFSYGHYGVNLFFMISGFVIFMTLDRTRNALDFVVSRFSRLYPAYWAGIFITFGLVNTLGLPNKEATLLEALVNLTMFQEFLHVKHVDNVYWTLQVEVLFYLTMLVFFSIRLLDRIEPILWAWLGIRLAYLVTPLLFERDLPYLIGKMLIQAHIPYFTLGIVFFRIRQASSPSLSHIGLIAAALLLINFGDSLLSFFVASAFTLIFWLFIRGRLSVLTWEPFVFLGTISYSFYLLHENVGWAFIRRIEQQGWNSDLAILASILITISLASTVTFLIEKPAMANIRARYRKSRTPQSLTA
jgi:peptidoglycan/LPS O-acetylase OafA/YrhL